MRPLHVALVSSSGRYSGSGLAVTRLHEAIQAHGHLVNLSSTLITKNKPSGLPNALEYPITATKRLYWGLLEKSVRTTIKFLFVRKGGHRTIALLPTGLPNFLGKLDADVINFHWIGETLLSINQLGSISVPVVFTVHDYWLFLGTQHYPGYSQDSSNGRVGTFDQYLIDAKKRAVANSMGIICPSSSMAHRVREMVPSSVGIEVVPNPIGFSGLSRRAPKNRIASREFKILSVMSGDLEDGRKGVDLLFNFLEIFAQTCQHEFEFHLVGTSLRTGHRGIPHVNHGFLEPSRLQALMAEMDLLVVPSRDETFCQVAIEGMYSGLPIVGFRIPALVEVLKGYSAKKLVKPFCTEELATAAMEMWQHRLHPNPETAFVDIPNRYDALGTVVRYRSALDSLFTSKEKRSHGENTSLDGV